MSARCAVPPGEVDRWLGELAFRGRVSVKTPVEVADEAGALVLTAVVDWFIAKRSFATETGVADDARRQSELGET